MKDLDRFAGFLREAHYLHFDTPSFFFLSILAVVDGKP